LINHRPTNTDDNKDHQTVYLIEGFQLIITTSYFEEQ